MSIQINYSYGKLCQPHVTLSITKEIPRSHYFYTNNLEKILPGNVPLVHSYNSYDLERC